jgi:serine/threonine-protein kinase
MSEARYLGKYEIMEELGRGGFGVVYKARDKILERLVAVKVLHPNLINDPSFVSRFRQEAIFSARFDHPNLVPVFDFDQAEGLYYLVMGYMPGGSLKQLLKKEGALPEDRAIQILSQVGSGLAYAHRKGVIHRDLKPANILFDAENEARVSDLGFAKALRSDSSASMSMSGGMIGTPAYMAPEVWRGNLASERSDLYSLGCILYEMLTGEVLFEGETPAMAMTKHLIEGPRFRQDLSEPWKSLLLKSLAMDPKERFQSAEAMLAAIARRRRPEPELYPGAFQPPAAQPAQDAHPAPMPRVLPSQARQGFSLPPEPRKSVQAQAKPSLPNQQGMGPASQPAPKQPNQKKRKLPVGKTDSRKWIIGAGIGLLFMIFGVLGFMLLNAQKQTAILPPATDTPVPTQTHTPTLTKTSTPLPTKTSTPTITPTPTPGVGSTLIRESDDMTMVYVPAGKFEMGSEDGYSNEKPVHTVELSAYWIDKYEISNAQYARCVAAGSCTAPRSSKSRQRKSYYGNPEYDNYPVIFVDWDQASTYCQWAGGRLPTEAEWEKAARGTDGRTWPWGNGNPNCDLANYSGCVEDTSLVDAHQDGASPYGALNMAGNVWEWVRDLYSNSYPSGQVKDPTGPTDGDPHVLRGGSWFNLNRYIRAASRYDNVPTNTSYAIGFRCVLPQP